MILNFSLRAFNVWNIYINYCCLYILRQYLITTTSIVSPVNHLHSSSFTNKTHDLVAVTYFQFYMICFLYSKILFKQPWDINQTSNGSNRTESNRTGAQNFSSIPSWSFALEIRIDRLINTFRVWIRIFSLRETNKLCNFDFLNWKIIVWK